MKTLRTTDIQKEAERIIEITLKHFKENGTKVNRIVFNQYSEKDVQLIQQYLQNKGFATSLEIQPSDKVTKKPIKILVIELYEHNVTTADDEGNVGDQS